MTKAVFTISPSSIYDDLPEEKYHFPKTYLRQAESTIGDWIIYYEPRRTEGQTSSAGLQAYFAVAKVERITPDQENIGHYYAHLSNFLSFDSPVPFREGNHYFESRLRKDDGTTNKGAFGRAVRNITDSEYRLILQHGFTKSLNEIDPEENIHTSEDRPIYEQLIKRPFRDRAFRKTIKSAYDQTCAVTGFKLVNPRGNSEVEAAHIKPVEFQGPDSPRNGIALTRTAHWLLDNGLITFEDNLNLVVSDKVPSEIGARLFTSPRRATPPNDSSLSPHPYFLRWHRENTFQN